MLFGVLFGTTLAGFVLAGTYREPPFVAIGLFAIGGAIFGLTIEIGRRIEE